MNTVRHSADPRFTHPLDADGAVRITAQGASEALALTADLIVLESAARVPADLDVSWLTQGLAQPGFVLVTATVGGRLAGFAAGHHAGDDMVLDRLVVAAGVVLSHPGLPVALLDELLVRLERPWADLVVPHDFVALPILRSQGWAVVDDTHRGLRLRAGSGMDA